LTALIRIDRAQAPPGAEDRDKPIRFCSRCGHPAEEPAGRPEQRRRVCERCGMGMLLTCARSALPGEAAAFAIVTFELEVAAVSEAGERVFGKEGDVVGSSLLDTVTSPLGNDALARHVSQAAQSGSRDPFVMPVRTLSDDGARKVGTLAARIATCGPPRAALVTVEPSEFGRR
jgi:hypothetical protein